MTEGKVPDDRSAAQDRPPRTPFSHRPIEYGSVAKLTRGTFSVDSDFPRSGFEHKDRTRASARVRPPREAA